MAIQQSKRQSDLEKRLQILRRQVYGKNNHQSSAISYQLPRLNRDDRRLTTESYSVSDLTYLHHDLLKILLFSSLAIGAQIILFFLLQNHLLKINF